MIKFPTRVRQILLFFTIALTLSVLRVPPILEIISRGEVDESERFLLILTILGPFILLTLTSLESIYSSVNKNSDLLEKAVGIASSSSPKIVKRFYYELYLSNEKVFEKLKIEPDEIYESVGIFRKLLKNATKEYTSTNSFFGNSPSTNLSYLAKKDIYDESMRFAHTRTNVIVKRYFLLYSPDLYKSEKDKSEKERRYESPEEIIKAMKAQYESKINIFYADISDIIKATDLTGRDLLDNIALIDNEISLVGQIDRFDNRLEKISFSWNKKDIDRCNYILNKLEKEEGKTLNRFESENDAEIQKWSSACVS